LQQSVERFLGLARRFEVWAAHGTDHGLAAARNGLRLIAQLYAAGQELPCLPDLADRDPEENLVSDEEWRQVFERAARLPFQYYSEVFNPLAVPPEDLVTGDLADDIADIFRDVVEGIRLFDRGLEDEALWEWVFGIRQHWGEHATSAMRALCWCIADGDPGFEAPDA
jgi:uncharacterized protein DUF5063